MSTTMKAGLTVGVLRNARLGDATVGGPSATTDSFTLVDAMVKGPSMPSDEHPEINLVRRVIGGRDYVHAVPLSLAGKQTMFGGNFIHTSDSRFRAVNLYPIPIHDRVEG